MPNLSLTNKELGDLIEYLEAKSGPPSKPEAAQAAAAAPVVVHAHDDHQHRHHHPGGEK
jgi:hypothetical protein